MYLELVAALLTYKVVTDLWDCFGFGCADLCHWLGDLAKKCEQRRAARSQKGGS